MLLVITPQMRPEPLHQRCHAEGLQIIVEVFPVRDKQPGRDALRDRPGRESKPCVKASAVVIAGDVKTLEAFRQTEDARCAADNAATLGRRGRTERNASMVSMSSPAARTTLGMPSWYFVPMQVAKRLPWFRQIRLAAAVCAKPGAMHARDAAIKLGYEE